MKVHLFFFYKMTLYTFCCIIIIVEKCMKNGNNIKKIIKNADKVFISGHKNLDLDALGSQIGMYMILKKKRKKCFIC